MKTIIVILSIICFATPGFSAKKHYGDIEDAEYVRNYDGDTITFNIPSLHPIIGENISIRLSGIDTPEIRGKCENEKIEAKKSKEYVRKMFIGAKHISLRDTRRGKYFRIVADIYIDDIFLKEKMIELGLGYPYEGKGQKHDWCLDHNN